MLFGWMKSLIIYLIFAGAVINLSPSGNYKKYIRFFTGLIAIILIMKPLSYIFEFDESMLYQGYSSFENAIWDNGEYDYESGTLALGEELSDYYDLGLSEGIKQELIKRGFDIVDISVTTDKQDRLIGCKVFVSKNSELDEAFEENEIKKYIFDVYNLEFDNIYVLRR